MEYIILNVGNNQVEGKDDVSTNGVPWCPQFRNICWNWMPGGGGGPPPESGLHGSLNPNSPGI